MARGEIGATRDTSNGDRCHSGQDADHHDRDEQFDEREAALATFLTTAEAAKTGVHEIPFLVLLGDHAAHLDMRGRV